MKRATFWSLVATLGGFLDSAHGDVICCCIAEVRHMILKGKVRK